MKTVKYISIALLTTAMIFPVEIGLSCSMYKVTVNGTTIVGCNEDAWRLTSRIWFENATKLNNYGAAFTGSRFDGLNGFAPQSGMNEFGLTFSRLAAPEPAKQPVTEGKKKPITNPTFYLKDIQHTCKTIADVKNYINQYDHSYFTEDVFMYIDRSGSYLVVEPFTIIKGKESKYVLSNFCPSATTEDYANKLERYHKGVEFLKNKIDTTLSFCTALSDTMHVCRRKIGDGTLLTSICDLKNGTTSLYFYHNYKQVVTFNIKDELAKGNHIFEIPQLFPQNPEFEKLVNYKIPQNSKIIMKFMFFCGALFLFSSLFFLASFIKNGTSTRFAKYKMLLSFLCVTMLYYVYVLAKNMSIFYFPAPCKDYEISLLNIAAYIPFLFLLLIIPLIIVNGKVIKQSAWSFTLRWLFIINNIAFTSLILFFCYWGLYDIFN